MLNPVERIIGPEAAHIGFDGVVVAVLGFAAGQGAVPQKIDDDLGGLVLFLREDGADVGVILAVIHKNARSVRPIGVSDSFLRKVQEGYLLIRYRVG